MKAMGKQFMVIALAGSWLLLLATARCYGEEEQAENPVALVRGTVVDDYNDQPIAGAAVLVTWHSAEPLPGGSPDGTAVAVSDRAGRFEFSQAAVPIVFGPYTRVIMEAVAPGYGVFQNYGAAAGENMVVLGARRLMKYDQCELSLHTWYAPMKYFVVDASHPPHFGFPPEPGSELGQQANAARAKMGLVPIDIRTGEPIDSGGVTCPAERPLNQWGPFTGRVVDKHTEQPIPGAICVVIWIRAIPFVVHDIEQFDDARVAVADRDGRFEIPGRLTLLGVFTKPPHLDCVAPGYQPYEDGPDKGPIEARLRPLPPDKRRPSASWTETLGLIPDDKRGDFNGVINARRRDLGLAPVDFVGGNLERGHK